MATLKLLLVLSLCVTVNCVHNCSKHGGVPHENKDGSVFCCELKTCHIGTYPQVCDHDERKVECIICPEGTYRDTISRSNESVHGCNSMTICDPRNGMKVLREGSRDYNRKCACNLEAGYYDYDFGSNGDNPNYCLREKCAAGFELHEDGECRECKVGHYKLNNGYERCIPWTVCAKINKEFVKYGTAVNDTTCKDPEDNTPLVGESTDKNEDGGGPPYEMIFGILGGVLVLVVLFVVFLFFINKSKYNRDKDAEKQGIKIREEVSSTVSSVPPYTKSNLSLDINKAKGFGKRRHGSSPDSGIADMKGYAPYFPSSEKLQNQVNQNFQYARDIQEDGGSTGDDHNTSFQGETIPEEDDICREDCKSVDTVDSAAPVVNHYYYFPPNGNVNLQVGKDNNIYAGGAPVDTPPTPDEYNNCSGMDYHVPVHESYNTTKHTVV